SATAAADGVVDELIAAALSGTDRARLTDAPAGAGKTGAVVRLVGALADAGARVGVVTQTNVQAFDVVERAAATHPRHMVGFLPASGIVLPLATAARRNVVLVDPATV